MEENNVNVEVEQTANVQTEQKHEEKTLTQDELNSILAKEKSKWQKKAEEDKEEAKKLAKMNAEEKAKYETEKKEKELENREKELNKRELTATAKEILADKGLSTELHTLLNYENAETVNDSIKNLESAIQKEIEKKVLERLKGNAPSKGATNTATISNFAIGAGLKN